MANVAGPPVEHSADRPVDHHDHQSVPWPRTWQARFGLLGLAVVLRRATTDETEKRFGVTIVDVQLKRINFPEQNQYAVYARMRAERDRIAKEYRAQGEEMAIKIRAEADRQRSELLAEAYREAEK
jgi:regulator of protease activity HflC (stomatin/prohibitin superfamily)